MQMSLYTPGLPIISLTPVIFDLISWYSDMPPIPVMTIYNRLCQSHPWIQDSTDEGCPSYAVNMFYYHWLIKKLIWSRVSQNRARREIQAKIQGRKKAESGRCQQPVEKQDVR